MFAKESWLLDTELMHKMETIGLYKI
uniref:Uncharacterized protein n=1 Tax=Acrobeloides nanus TaxID=290746 RepID=A0A914DH45_9BILA